MNSTWVCSACSYSNPTSVSRCSLCNSPRPSESASNREEPSSEATISVSSSVDVNPATLLSQQSSKLFSIDTNKSSSTRKTLGLKRTLTSSQRSLGLSRPNSLKSTLSLSESDIPKSGEVSRKASEWGGKEVQSVISGGKGGNSTISMEEGDVSTLNEKEISEVNDCRERDVTEVNDHHERDMLESNERDVTESNDHHERDMLESNERDVAESNDHHERDVTESNNTKDIKLSHEETIFEKEELSQTTHKETHIRKERMAIKKTKVPTIKLVGTMLSEVDRDVMTQLIMSLSNAKLMKRKSIDKANVVVTGRSARSVKVMCAVARNCPVVNKQWLYDSLEKGEWCPTEAYIDPIAKEGLENRRKSKHGVFQSMGPFFIQPGTSPSYEELKYIIEAADGKVTRSIGKASICIANQNDQEMDIPCVNERFVIEGVMMGKPPKVEDYSLNGNTTVSTRENVDSEEY